MANPTPTKLVYKLVCKLLASGGINESHTPPHARGLRTKPCTNFIQTHKPWKILFKFHPWNLFIYIAQNTPWPLPELNFISHKMPIGLSTCRAKRYCVKSTLKMTTFINFTLHIQLFQLHILSKILHPHKNHICPHDKHWAVEKKVVNS